MINSKQQNSCPQTRSTIQFERSMKIYLPWHSRLSLLLFAGLLMLLPGCSWLRWIQPVGNQPPSVFSKMASKEDIMARVNANSKAIQSMQARVHVRAQGTPTLSGDLSVEQPSRLRMQVGILNLNNSGLDVGSNDNEFWVWMKNSMGGQPPSVLYARHDEYRTSPAKQALPIEPSWVIDSLGLAYFDPRAEHDGPFQRPDGNLEIQSRFMEGNQQMIKSTIVDPNTSVVVAQELYRGNQKIAASKASRHEYFPEFGGSIPTEIEIEVGSNTAQPGVVSMTLSNILPNSINSQYASLWEMPRPKNINMVNIARQGPVSSNATPRQFAQHENVYQGQPNPGQPVQGQPENGQYFPGQGNNGPVLSQNSPAQPQNPNQRANFEAPEGSSSLRGFDLNRSGQ